MNEKVKILSNGVKMPLIGFGTYKSGNEQETVNIIKQAIDAGYRMIDTASYYGNEEGIGRGIKESKVARDELFLVTKLWNEDHGYEKTIEAFNKSLEKLQVDYLDLYLIHWPNKLNKETWRAFEHLYKIGKIKAIGVCNFKIKHLEELMENAEIKPMVNQVEVHPLNCKEDMLKYCNENNIALQAWSPIMRGKLFTSDIILNLSEKYNKSASQIILKWHMQRGVIPMPKSSNEERIKENIDIFDFNISKEDMETITSLNEGDNASVSGVPENTTYLD